MEERIKVISGILGILIVIATFNLIGNKEPTHACESLKLKMYCDRTTAVYCYPTPGTRLGSKKCAEGWKEIQFEPYKQRPDDLKEIHCTSKGCI